MSLPQVVNVRVASIRPEYTDLSEWIQDTDNLYIGRKGIVFINGERYPKTDSFWANPYKVGRDGTRDEVGIMYRRHIIDKVHTINQEEAKRRVHTLRVAKRIGCWCKPEVCHGDILVELLADGTL